MKAIDFDDANVKVAKGQKQYTTLPALRFNDDFGTMVTKWKLTRWERLKVLFTGVIWMSEMTFDKNVTPRHFKFDRKDVYSKPNDTKTK